MNVRNTFACAFACLLAAFVGFSKARAQISETADVTVSVTIPTFNINLNNLNFGATYYARNHTSSSASATVSPAVVLSHVRGSVGGARLVELDTTGANKLRVNITGGIPAATVALTLRDDNAPANAYLTLTGDTTPGDAVFRVDTWTFAIQPGGGSLSGFTGANGAGTITLNGAGEIDIFFGATLRTVPSALSYSAQSYTGTLRVTANY